MTNKTHFFATHALGYAKAETRLKAVEKLLLQNTDPSWVRNCLKDGHHVTVFSCEVHGDIDEGYRVEWYQPKDIEISDGRNEMVTYLTKTKFALMRDPQDEITRLRAELKELRTGGAS